MRLPDQFNTGRTVAPEVDLAAVRDAIAEVPPVVLVSPHVPAGRAYRLALDGREVIVRATTPDS